jgi:hypothetical protein
MPEVSNFKQDKILDDTNSEVSELRINKFMSVSNSTPGFRMTKQLFLGDLPKDNQSNLL